MMFYDVLGLKSIPGFLLSERTSGISPVIFIVYINQDFVNSAKFLYFFLSSVPFHYCVFQPQSFHHAVGFLIFHYKEKAQIILN